MAIQNTHTPGRVAASLEITDALLTAREGAAELRISIPTFWRWVGNGTLPKAVKLGGLSRWPQSELLAVIERAKAKRNAA